jgi:hypothetical protein
LILPITRIPRVPTTSTSVRRTLLLRTCGRAARRLSTSSHYWPPGMRVIVGKERPHPGAQLRFTDRDRLRLTAFATNAAAGQVPDLKLRHRRRAPLRRLSRSPVYPDVFGVLLVVACLGGMDVGIIRRHTGGQRSTSAFALCTDAGPRTARHRTDNASLAGDSGSAETRKSW